MKPIWPAVLLAWIAGFVDSLGYLALDKVFTAHMSGNSAAVGAALGSGNWHEAMVRGAVIPGFILGIAVGTLVGALGRRQGARPKLLPALVVEIALLLAFIAIEPHPAKGSASAGTLEYFLRVWLLASAMGIQSAALRRAGGARVHTTYVTGMLAKMTENAVRYFSGKLTAQQRLATSEPPAHPNKGPGRRAAVFGLIFFSFMLGGVCGGLGETQWSSVALLVPVGCLVFLVVAESIAL